MSSSADVDDPERALLWGGESRPGTQMRFTLRMPIITITQV